MTNSGTPATSLNDRVAEEIRVALARRRMSAAQLARKLGVSQTYVWRRLISETSFDLTDIERIAGVLDVEVVDLLPARRRPAVRDIAPYPGQPERRSAVAHRPADNRPPVRPETPTTIGVRRTSVLPRIGRRSLT